MPTRFFDGGIAPESSVLVRINLSFKSVLAACGERGANDKNSSLRVV